jgi:hypothetical protein
MRVATAPQSALALEPVFEYETRLKAPVAIGSGQYGTRVFYEVEGGVLTGPRVSGEILTGGGDWALIGPDGWTRVDVRGQCRTDDGAVLYFSYRGLIEPSRAVARAVREGGETAFEDHYWRVAMEVETGHPDYQWLTQSALVGRGRVCAGPGVAYQIFRVD